MIMEIVEGIRGTDANAEVIGEIGTSYNKWTETEQKFLKRLLWHISKQKPISTHTSIGTLGHEQVEFLKT